MGIVLRGQGQLTEAIKHFKRALSAKGNFGGACLNLGCALYEHRHPDAVKYLEQAISLNGESVELLELLGLVHAEQGAGDVIQFIRFVPGVAKLGAKVVVECGASVAPLVAGVAGVSETIISGGKLPKFDLQCPLASLPRILRTRPATIPREVPYLVPNSEKIAAWQSRLASESPGLKIGIAWTGSRLHANNRKRSCRPAEFLPFIRSGLTLYSLQKEHDDTDELSRLGVVDHTAELRDFGDTAALISCLDMVISVDTSVAHLAGALGKPTWLLLPYAPDWRWLLEREDSPWYPTMRLFRQPRPGAWRAVMAAVSTMVGEMLPARGEAAPVSLTRGAF